ncbi:protein kinase domain-containing protein [Endozoicomonas euniceicola]|uniref:Protein kinase n=1 Tax=Endozoicomonas euniceicola TaxID=1234143 RepID=A0ABY6GTR3_9GAMM|nr:protein kinase [Endozoicomonas euniceicola]UYM16165.1 protein kinase [Endozoicomonas euniceicola]
MSAVSLFRRFTLKSLSLILLLPALTDMASASFNYIHARRLTPSQYPAWVVNAIWTDSGLVIANRAGTGEMAKSVIKLPPAETRVVLELCVAALLSKNDTTQLLEHGIPFADTASSPDGNVYWFLKINTDPHKAVTLNLDLEVVSHCTSVAIQDQHYSHRDSIKTNGDIPPVLSTGEDFQVSLKVVEEEQAGTFPRVPEVQPSGGLSNADNYWDSDPSKFDKPHYPGGFSNPKLQPFDLMVAYLQSVFSWELINHWLQLWFQYAVQHLNTPEEALRTQENHLEDLFLLIFSTETGNYQIYNQRLSDGHFSENRLGFHISEQGAVSPYAEIHQTVERLYLPLRLVRIDSVTGDYVEVTERVINPDTQQDSDDIHLVSYIKTLIEQEALFWRCDFIGLTFSANLKQLAQRLQASMSGHFSFLPEETASNINNYLSYLFISLAVPDAPSRTSPFNSVRRQLGRALYKQLGSDKTRLLIGKQGIEYLQAIGNRISNKTTLKPESLVALMTVLFSNQVVHITGTRSGQKQPAKPINTGLFRQVPTDPPDSEGVKKAEQQDITTPPVATLHSRKKITKSPSGDSDRGGGGEDPSHFRTCQHCQQKPASGGLMLCQDCAAKTQDTQPPSLAASLFIPKSATQPAHYKDTQTSLREMLGLTRERKIHSGTEREVWQYRNGDNQKFAVKVFMANRDSNLNKGEPNALQIDHPNIARTHAMVLEKNGAYTVADSISQVSSLSGYDGCQPLAVISSLATGFRLNDDQFFEFLKAYDDPAGLVTELTLTLCKALKYLHEEHALMHRDIKPENIIYNPVDGTIKVIDFGTSTTISSERPRSVVGTREHYAPELFHGRTLGGYDETVDTWAAGTVLMELLTGMTPFNYNRCYTDSPLLEPEAKRLQDTSIERINFFSAKPEEYKVRMLQQHLLSPFNKDNIPAELLHLTASILSWPKKRPKLDAVIEQLSYIKGLLVLRRCADLFHGF